MLPKHVKLPLRDLLLALLLTDAQHLVGVWAQDMAVEKTGAYVCGCMLATSVAIRGERLDSLRQKAPGGSDGSNTESGEGGRPTDTGSFGVKPLVAAVAPGGGRGGASKIRMRR